MEGSAGSRKGVSPEHLGFADRSNPRVRALSEPVGNRVLITGAAGHVGGLLRSHWGDRYRLRLADRRPVEELAGHEEFVEVDITDKAQMLEVCRLCEEGGLPYTIGQTFGAPGETRETVDRQLAFLQDCSEEEVRCKRKSLGIGPVFKTVDTCAAEFEAHTPYHYSTYEREDESERTQKKKIMILGKTVDQQIVYNTARL